MAGSLLADKGNWRDDREATAVPKLAVLKRWTITPLRYIFTRRRTP